MKKKLILVTAFLIFYLLHSCREEKRKVYLINPEDPTIVEAKAPFISKDHASPEIIPVKKVKAVVAGNPVIIVRKSNIYCSGKPEIIIAGKPFSAICGQGIYKLPDVMAVSSRSAVNAMPEVNTVSDATIKDDDPANFSSYKVLQGLKQPLIRSMMQDKNGNLWFGTYSGGVTKYDGKFFTNYTTTQGLGNDGIWSMLQDSQGNYWFGTYGGGLTKYDGKTFTNYNISGGYDKNVVWAIIEDKNGNLWFGTNNGAIRYDGNSFTKYTPAQGLGNNFVHSIIQDKSNNVWFGTYKGLTKFDGKIFSTYAKKQGLLNDSILSLMIDKKENIWIGTSSGIAKFDGNRFLNYSFAQNFINAAVQNIHQDRDEKIWLGTPKGIILFDENPLHPEKSTYTHYSTKDGLNDDDITSVLEDNAGNLWFGTNGGGAARFDGRMFSHFTTVEGLGHNKVKQTAEDKLGNLWFATWGGGITKYDGKSFTTYTVKQGLSSNNVFSLLIDRNGVLWLGTGKGVSRFDGKTFTNYAAEQGLTNDQVWNIFEDRDGHLWFGTFGSGTFKYDGTNFIHLAQPQGLRGGIVECMIQDKAGVYWIGTFDGGLNRYDGSSFEYYRTDEGLSNNEVMDMCQDEDGNIWIGTIGGGVNKFDGKSFTHYSTNQGLSNEIVMGIMPDKSGNLWISTRNGLNRIDNFLSPGNNKDKLIFKNYMYADGFLGVNCWVNSIFEDSKKNIWIGTDDRLTCYHPEGDIPDTIPPVIQLYGLALFNENINWLNFEKKKDTSFILSNGVEVGNFKFDSLLPYNNIPANLNLSHNNNYLTFKYVGITTKRPYKVRYVSKLEGLDENWSSITDRTEVSYGNLPFGDYTFKVKARNSEGYWSYELKYPFSITPPWWKTYWFRSLEIIFILLIFYSIYRFRLNQVLHFQTIRNKIAHDLHDDIGSTLNSISVYSEVAKQDASKHTNALEMIGEASRKIIDSMSDIIWAINPENDSFENIILRMRSLTYNLLRAKNIEFIFRVDDSLNNIKLTMEKRRNFFLIFKEAINNLVKYADASNVSIQLLHESSLIKLIIRDNGSGFDTTQTSAGNGLNNMKRRAVEINAQLQIESHVNEGTSIELILRS